MANERDAEIWRLHCMGVKQAAIARRLQLSQPTVHRAVRRMRDRIEQGLDEQGHHPRWPMNNLNKPAGCETAGEGDSLSTLGSSPVD